MERTQMSSDYLQAVKAIKTAILQSQYRAARSVNREQLALYFSIGKHDPQDYNKPMGVATYKVTQERLRELLPPEEEMKRLISGGE